MRGKYVINFDLAHATVQQATDESLLGPREFKSMVNWIPDNGVLVPRESFFRVYREISLVDCAWNQGVFAIQRSANSCWLLAIQGNSTGYGLPIALHLDFSGESVDALKQIIVAEANSFGQQHSTRPGQLWSFCEYRGSVFVSDGYQTWAWTGDTWHGPNNSGNTSHLAVCREFAFANAVEFEGRLVRGGDSCYGNALSYTDIWADVDINTEETGNPELGELAGTGVTASLRAMDFIAGLGYAGGQDEALIKTVTAGKKWIADSPPDDEQEGRHIFGAAIDSNSALWVVTANDDDTDGYGTAGKIWMRAAGASTWSDEYNSHLDYFVKFARLRRSVVGSAQSLCFVGAYKGTDVITRAAYTYTPDNGATWYLSSVDSPNLVATDMVVFDASSTPRKLVCASTTDTSGTTKSAVYLKLAGEGSGSPWATPLKVEYEYNLKAIFAYEYSAVVVGDKGYVGYSSDFGATWAAVTDSDTSENLRDVLIIGGTAGGHLGLACGDNGTIVRHDGAGMGGTWTSIDTGVYADLYALAFDGTYVYASGDAGVVLRSSDRGESWEEFTESENRFMGSVNVGVNEDIRFQYRTKGMLYVFTDKAAYSYNNQFGQNVVTPGFVIAAPRCCLESYGTLWVLGFYLGKPGLWRWDGVNAPVLASSPVHDTIAAAKLQPVPQRVWFVNDSEVDFTPRNGGMTYNSSTSVTYKNGILKLKQGKTATIYSHGDGISVATDTTGYYLPEKTAAVQGDFGHLALEVAFNDSDSASTLEVQARYGYGTPGSITWTSTYDATDWTALHNDKKSYTKQGVVFGRLTFRLVAPSDANNYQFVQFKIKGTRGSSINTNWAINRIAVCATVRDLRNSGVTPPFMYVYDDRVYAMLGNSTGIVVSNGGESFATITDNCPVSAVSACDRIIEGVSNNNGLMDIRFSHSGGDVDGFTQSLQTGRLGITDSPRSMLLRKKPRTAILAAVPTNGAAESILTVGRWTNGNSANAVTKTGLTFARVHQPENSLLQIRAVTFPSAPSSTASYGNDFTLLVTNTTTANPCKLKMLSADFDVEAEEGRVTD